MNKEEIIKLLSEEIKKAEESDNNSLYAKNVISDSKGLLSNFTNPVKQFNWHSIPEDTIKIKIWMLKNVQKGYTF
jgi:hypothetical protein